MQNVMRIIETGRKLRENKKISLKQPIMSLTVVNKSQKLFEQLKPFLPYIEDEINVASIKNETDINKFVRL
jgi:isoleucyl-tRNA synthetase